MSNGIQLRPLFRCTSSATLICPLGLGLRDIAFNVIGGRDDGLLDTQHNVAR